MAHFHLKLIFVFYLATLAFCSDEGSKSGEVDNGAEFDVNEVDSENDSSFEVDTWLPEEDNSIFNEEVLIVAWEPHPIDLWQYIIVNVTGEYVAEKSRLEITQFTKQNFPDVKLVFTAKPGDYSYFPNDLQVPIVGVDAFENDYYFQQYLNIIYTMHGFTNPTELWAHFFQYPDAFDPVRFRVNSAFEEYVQNYRYEVNDNNNSGSQEQDNEFYGEYDEVPPFPEERK